MAAATRPRSPLVAIFGSTGTGKSDLAVDLAVKFNGEIINADAMQLYKGLPIITNQITVEEQRGIPHHLIDKISLDEPTWTVFHYAKVARKLIQDIRDRGKLPILVGGTNYYIQSILFDDILDEVEQEPSRTVDVNDKDFPILDAPNDVLLNRLREVDPVMANRWHPDDRRKIQRSLQIFLTTGQRASEIYAEQEEAIAKSMENGGSWETLVFWVYTKREVLLDRLSNRITKMEARGLMDEVRELGENLQTRIARGETVDRNRGIWQSIGFSQMEPYLLAEAGGSSSQKQLDRLKVSGLEQMNFATRQYARSQIKWIVHKTGPALKKRDALDYLYVLDSSDIARFQDDVLEPASDICRAFLEGNTRRLPSDISDTAKEVLAPFQDNKAKPQHQQFPCELCNKVLMTEEQWQKHLQGRGHKKNMKYTKRRALVVVDSAEHEATPGDCAVPEQASTSPNANTA